MATDKDYCFTCKKEVVAAKGKCPICDKVLWTAMATNPFDYKHKLRTTSYSQDALLKPREFERRERESESQH